MVHDRRTAGGVGITWRRDETRVAAGVQMK